MASCAAERGIVVPELDARRQLQPVAGIDSIRRRTPEDGLQRCASADDRVALDADAVRQLIEARELVLVVAVVVRQRDSLYVTPRHLDETALHRSGAVMMNRDARNRTRIGGRILAVDLERRAVAAEESSEIAVVPDLVVGELEPTARHRHRDRSPAFRNLAGVVQAVGHDLAVAPAHADADRTGRELAVAHGDTPG